MTDKNIEELEYQNGDKHYIIAYSLAEQKRANDLKLAEIEQRQNWHTMLIVLFAGIIAGLFMLYLKLDSMDVITKLVS